MHSRAVDLIARLSLEPHPEGGYFREVFRSPARVGTGDARGDRAALTSIYFLLVAGETSCWHRVSSDEVWHLLEGDPLDLYDADPDLVDVAAIRLAPAHGDVRPVHTIAAGRWQAARTTGAYTLVSCTVAPGFEFADFEMMRDRPADVSRLRARHPTLTALL